MELPPTSHGDCIVVRSFFFEPYLWQLIQFGRCTRASWGHHFPLQRRGSTRRTHASSVRATDCINATPNNAGLLRFSVSFLLCVTGGGSASGTHSGDLLELGLRHKHRRIVAELDYSTALDRS